MFSDSNHAHSVFRLKNKIAINGTEMKNPLLSHAILVVEVPNMGNGGISLTGLKPDDYSPWEEHTGPGPYPFKSSAGVYVVKGRPSFSINLPYLSTISFNGKPCSPQTPLFTFNS